MNIKKVAERSVKKVAVGRVLPTIGLLVRRDGLGKAVTPIVMVLLMLLGTGHAAATPSGSSDPAADADGTGSSQRSKPVDPGADRLLQSVLPPPVGNPFFDDFPPGLADMVPGELIDVWDISPTAAPLFPVPSRVVLLKYRTTGAGDDPSDASFATASLTVPLAPWAGAGDRPVYVNNLAINSLGRGCSPSYLMTGLGAPPEPPDKDFPPITTTALLNGFAVLTTDHEGPNMTYGEPYVAGHAILDGIRAMRAYSPAEFTDSRFAMSGYSGGAIATHGAVKLIDSYAPELREHIVGAALGGIPVDYQRLLTTMNGNVASGLLAAASLGVARAHPTMLELMSEGGLDVASSDIRRLCSMPLSFGGLGALPLETFLSQEALERPELQPLFARLRMADIPSGTPLLIYNGANDLWIPAAGARELAQEQCDLGVSVEYFEGPAEHLTSEVLHFPRVFAWVRDRLTEPDPTPITTSCRPGEPIEAVTVSAS